MAPVSSLSAKVRTMHSFIVILLGGGIYGYNTAIISGIGGPMILCNYFPAGDSSLTPNEADSEQSLWQGLLTSCILLGGVLGSFGSVPFANKFGRCRGLQASGLLGCIALLFFAPTSFAATIAIRTILGASVGSCGALCPLYNTEVTPSDKRGLIGTCFQVGICSMILLAYIVNYAFKPDYAPESDDPSLYCLEEKEWRLQLALGAIPCLGLFVYGFIAPETETWLDQHAASSTGTAPYRAVSEGPMGDPYGDAGGPESGATKATSPFEDDDLYVARNDRGWSSLFNGSGVRWTLIGLGLACAQQLTGINAIIFYSPEIFREGNLGDVLVLTILIVGLWNLLSVLPAVYLVERMGRRPLMLIGMSGVTLGALIMAITYAALDGTAKTVCSVLGIMIFIFSFEIGPGALFFLLASETFPESVKHEALVLTNAFGWATNIMLSFTFPVLKNGIGPAGTFGIFAAFGALSVIFVYTCLPETRGKVEEEDPLLSKSADRH